MPCLLQCRQAIAVIGGQQAKIAIFSVGDRRIFFRLSFSATKSLDANRKESLRLAELCGCWESGTRQIHPANFCLLLFVCVCQNTKRVHTMCSRIVQHQKKKKKKKKKERNKKKKNREKKSKQLLFQPNSQGKRVQTETAETSLRMFWPLRHLISCF